MKLVLNFLLSYQRRLDKFFLSLLPIMPTILDNSYLYVMVDYLSWSLHMADKTSFEIILTFSKSVSYTKVKCQFHHLTGYASVFLVPISFKRKAINP